MNFSEADKKLLEKIHRLFLSLEKNSSDKSFSSKDLSDLKELLIQCGSLASPELRRLAEIPKHLHLDMTLRHFVSYLVPVERLINKKLQDDDFLISSLDRKESLAEVLPLIFVLDNIRSAFNVGSLFRTAECLNIEALYLCGYTPTPDQEKVDKTALGTVDKISWKSFTTIDSALADLKQKGYTVVAFETAEKALSLYESFDKQPTAFVFGNERFGLDAKVLGLVSEVRSIPLRGQKNSLNVGVTAAVAGFEWVRQWNIMN